MQGVFALQVVQRFMRVWKQVGFGRAKLYIIILKI